MICRTRDSACWVKVTIEVYEFGPFDFLFPSYFFYGWMDGWMDGWLGVLYPFLQYFIHDRTTKE